jgi:transcriptional regulator GlxA family with amidase domain
MASRWMLLSLSMHPVSAAAQRAWARTAELVRAQLVTSAVAEIYPLVVAEMTRLVAMVFLETFPNTTMTVSHQPGPGWVAPAVVQRAVTYIEANAHQPVTVDQIAAAAGVGSRALQNAFRRYFGMTPPGYLRRVRLERAYQELGAADPAGGLTVAAVAHRWGWASASRFAVAYRQRFGMLPSHTLRT